jgi:hypothetical protein
MRVKIMMAFPNFNGHSVYWTYFIPKFGTIHTEPLNYQTDADKSDQIEL